MYSRSLPGAILWHYDASGDPRRGGTDGQKTPPPPPSSAGSDVTGNTI